MSRARYSDSRNYRAGWDAYCLGEKLDKSKPRDWQDGWSDSEHEAYKHD